MKNYKAFICFWIHLRSAVWARSNIALSFKKTQDESMNVSNKDSESHRCQTIVRTCPQGLNIASKKLANEEKRFRNAGAYVGLCLQVNTDVLRIKLQL